MNDMRDNMEMRRLIEKFKNEMQEKILQLLKDGKDEEKIAEILNVELFVINARMREMDHKKVEDAKLLGKKKVREETSKRREEEKKVKGEASKRREERNKTKEKAGKQENDKNEKESQTDERILELLGEGKTQKQIAKILGKSQSTISDRISRMNNRDPNKMQEIQQQIEEEKKEKERQRNERILELLGEGKTQIKIAEIMETTNATISKWVKQIGDDKVNEAKKKGDERILQLKRAGKTVEEIAEIVEVSQFIIIRRINKMNAEQKNEQEENREETDEMMEASSPTISDRVRQVKDVPDYGQLKRKLKEHTITRDEINDYREYLDDKYDKIELKEVILMSNMYIKTKRTAEAITFLNILIRNEDMEYLGKEKLKEAVKETERIGIIQRAKELLKANKTIAEIVEITGLSDIEAIRIRNQIQGNEERE